MPGYMPQYQLLSGPPQGYTHRSTGIAGSHHIAASSASHTNAVVDDQLAEGDTIAVNHVVVNGVARCGADLAQVLVLGGDCCTIRCSQQSLPLNGAWRSWTACGHLLGGLGSGQWPGKACRGSRQRLKQQHGLGESERPGGTVSSAITGCA